MRVKVSKVLHNTDYEKCLNDKEHSLLVNSFNDINTNSSRFSLRSGCDNKPKKKFFKDLEKSLKEIEKEKINQQGEILTNKILGTTTITRKQEENGEDKMDELVQSGSGRKRKHQSDNASHSNIKKRRKYRKKSKKKITKKISKHKVYKKRSPHHKKNKRGKKKKSHKSAGLKKHHYKHHNIFRNC